MHLCYECGIGYPTLPADMKCANCGGHVVSYAQALEELGRSVGRRGEGGRGVAPEAIRDGIMGWRMRAYAAEKALERITGIDLNDVVERLARGGDPVLDPATINLALTEEDKDRMVPLAHASGRTLSCWALAAVRAAASPRSGDGLREALEAAAKSLEWIANRRASSDEGRTTLDVLSEIRQYANSRAGVARTALSAAPRSEAGPGWLSQRLARAVLEGKSINDSGIRDMAEVLAAPRSEGPHPNPGVAEGFDGETCRSCGQPFSDVWRAPDSLWTRLTGRSDGGGIQCMTCFSLAAYAQGVVLYWECAANEYPTAPRSEGDGGATAHVCGRWKLAPDLTWVCGACGKAAPPLTNGDSDPIRVACPSCGVPGFTRAELSLHRCAPSSPAPTPGTEGGKP